MPRILILYVPLGDGHNSAAKALGEAFAHYSDVEVQVEDAFDYASPILRETITRLYKQLSEKSPQLYRMIYEGSDIEDPEDSLSSNLLFAQIERPFFRKLELMVKETNPDAIVCVQQIPSRFLQLLEREGKLSKPHYVVITDVIAHSTWINPGVTRYFVPTELSANVLLQRGVEPLRIQVTGIPVKLEISELKSMQEMRLRHDLPTDVPLVTLFGGGLQPQRVRSIVANLLQRSQPGTLVVVAGRNASLLESLADLTDGSQIKLRKLGTIDFVDDLVAASDLVISKAGGLIVSEVLARGTPMVIIDPFPGQEEWNADMVAASGAGIQLRLPEAVAPAVDYLLSQPEQLAFMRDRARIVGQPRAALEIAERILKDLQS
jgi:processive 1,2-diacylglycerol beta-glucosyltransferase